MPLGGGRSSGPGASYGDLAPAELHRAGSFPQWANTDPPASLAHHSVRAALLRARLPSARQRHSPVQANGSCVSSSRVGSMSNTNSSSGRSSGSSSRDGSASVLQYLMSLACNTAEGSAVDPLVGNGAAAAAAEAAAALGEDGGCGTGGKEGAMGGGVGAAVLEASAGGSSNSDSGELTRSCSSDCDTAFRQLYDSVGTVIGQLGGWDLGGRSSTCGNQGVAQRRGWVRPWDRAAAQERARPGIISIMNSSLVVPKILCILLVTPT